MFSCWMLNQISSQHASDTLLKNTLFIMQAMWQMVNPKDKKTNTKDQNVDTQGYSEYENTNIQNTMYLKQRIHSIDTNLPIKQQNWKTATDTNPQKSTKGREPNSAAALASQLAADHSLSFYYYYCFLTLY